MVVCFYGRLSKSHHASLHPGLYSGFWYHLRSTWMWAGSPESVTSIQGKLSILCHGFHYAIKQPSMKRGLIYAEYDGNDVKEMKLQLQQRVENRWGQWKVIPRRRKKFHRGQRDMNPHSAACSCSVDTFLLKPEDDRQTGEVRAAEITSLPPSAAAGQLVRPGALQGGCCWQQVWTCVDLVMGLCFYCIINLNKVKL